MRVSDSNDPGICQAFPLNNDILWLIFNENADISPNSQALTSTRLSSQVCSDWRSVILNAPSLWGKLLNIDDLKQQKDDWRNLVLRRSGNSPLSITGSRFTQWTTPSEERLPWQTFFFSLLDQHWGRIETLSVTVNKSLTNTSLWKAVYNPAPLIRVFELRFHPNIGNIFSPLTPIGPVFANHAPLLDTFEAMEIKFQPTAPWLSNIRSLSFGDAFTSLMILDTLKMTHKLEMFRVNNRKRRPVDKAINAVNIPSLALPYLKQIDLEMSLIPGASLLGCMSDLDICSVRSLNLRLVDTRTSTRGHDGQENLTRSFQVLSRITRIFFAVHMRTTMYLTVGSRLFRLQAGSTREGSLFSFDLRCPSWRPQNVMAGILVEFNMAVFNTVLELHLTCDGFSTEDLTDAYRSFLSSFSSIRTLVLDRENLLGDILYISTETSETLFPLLKTLKYDKFEGGEFAEGLVRKFVAARRDIGHPISTLDITACPQDLKKALSTEFLADSELGLKILWRRQGMERFLEHVCGGGSLQNGDLST